MRYYSSRNNDITTSAHKAVIQGLAPDGGLFVPNEIPQKLDPKDILNLSYQETAKRILARFLDDYSDEDLTACVYGAYDTKFDTEEIVPVSKTKDGYLMELYHGPTSAFKDVALTILPRLLTAAYKQENLSDTISILTATSGDTGKAALSGFQDVEHTAVTVFYPEDGVSTIQKAQMQTARGNNVKVIAVKGNFDDCQRMVKEACSSKEVLDACNNVTISSANSINIGRLVPQIVYYYSSYAKLVNAGDIACGDEVNFVVPTGNFGDILAGYLAKKIGLPIRKLICAANTNNVLTDFIKNGKYDINRPFHLTMSPSMDILISSNLERLLYLASNGDADMVASCMQAMKDNGSYEVSKEILDTIQEDFGSYWTSEEDCKKEIKDLFENERRLIDPHTAIAYHAMRQYKEETGDTVPCIVLSTASPYKFSKNVLSSLTDNVPEDEFEAMNALAQLSGMPIPQGLAELKDLPVRFTEVIAKEDGISAIAQRMKELSHD